MFVSNLLSMLIAKILGKQVGKDEIGNRYFVINSPKREFQRERRIVIYDMKKNSNMVVNENWNNWLKYLTNEMPGRETISTARIKSTGGLYEREKNKHYSSWSG